MSKLKIHIENEKSAYLEIENYSNDFGIFSKTKNNFFIGFGTNPIFEINHSLVNERWFIEVLPNGRRIPQENVPFDRATDEWLRDSCCTNFSIFNFLPNGKYRLIKTNRKIQFSNEILFGNEWTNSPKNILTFDGIKEKDSLLTGNADKFVKKQRYYPLIVGSNANLAPVVNQPLLCVVLLDYGIVWEGATGFIFFSFENDELIMPEKKKIILLIPYNDSFAIDCMNNKKQSYKKIIDDFIKII
jgi:hypothetical protein